MEVIVTDRETIEAGLLVRSSYVVISIHDPDKRRAKVRKQAGLRDVLFLGFHDAEPTSSMEAPPEIKMMSDEQSESVRRFVEKYRTDVGAVVVHCEQGMSRSPAVAAAICRALGLSESRFWREYQPNRLVYRSVLHAYRQAHTGDPS